MNIKRKETIYEGFYTFSKLIVEKNGETFEREQLDIGCAAAALVYDTLKEKYILVKQYRYSAARELLEVVAGIVENQQADPEATIKKEIAEETGYVVDRLEHIMDFFPSPGACTEKVFLYYAEVSHRKHAGGGLDEEHEDIRVMEYSLPAFMQLPLLDAKTIMARQWLSLKLGASPQQPLGKLEC